MNEEVKIENPLGTKPLGGLLFSLALPAIIANVFNALYNIVDQIFIGQGVGLWGNAATSIAFPLTTICSAIGLITVQIIGILTKHLGETNNFRGTSME